VLTIRAGQKTSEFTWGSPYPLRQAGIT